MAKAAHLHAADVSTVNGIVTARLIGPAIEEHRGNAIRETVARAMDDAADALRFVVLDFGNVSFINSTAIAACIELRNAAEEQNVPTIIYRPENEVRNMFRKAKLDKLFEIVESAAELDARVG